MNVFPFSVILQTIQVRLEFIVIELMDTIKSSFAATGQAQVTIEQRQKWALKAFTHTAEYDDAISNYFRQQ